MKKNKKGMPIFYNSKSNLGFEIVKIKTSKTEMTLNVCFGFFA
jgi:hypothetical protein